MDRRALRRVPLAALPALACTAWATPPYGPVSTQVFERHLARVASDEFEGRKIEYRAIGDRSRAAAR